MGETKLSTQGVKGSLPNYTPFHVRNGKFCSGKAERDVRE